MLGLVRDVLQSEKRGLPAADVICGVFQRLGKSGRPSAALRGAVSRLLLHESRNGGLLLRSATGTFLLRSHVRRRLRRMVRRRLAIQGFQIARGGALALPMAPTKPEIRSLHHHARQEKLEASRGFIERRGHTLSRYFADGRDIDLARFAPRVVLAEQGSEAAALFRLATLLWSVPVSHGFGRRLRFVIMDDANDKLVGLFALGDPVFNLRCRDQWIGWTHIQRAARLYNVMDIFVLGAIPPYSDLLCGKLTALAAVSNETRKIVADRYRLQRTIIQGKQKDPTLALLTTTSALGRSSLYNRITLATHIVYANIGETQGWGHFHLHNGTFTAMIDYLRATNHHIVRAHQYGDGPNWRMRAAKAGLTEIGLSSDLLQHGIRRQVYGAPLGSQFREFLRGDVDDPCEYDLPLRDLISHFKTRWFLPRAAREPRFLGHSGQQLYHELLAGLQVATTPLGGPQYAH